MYDDNDDIATMGRSNIITMDSGWALEPSSLTETPRQHHNEKGSPGAWRLALFLRVLFLYQVWSHLYLSLWYLVPFLLQDFQPWLQHCFNAFACYLCAALMANWLCIIHYSYSNEYKPPRDRQDIGSHVIKGDIQSDRFSLHQVNHSHHGNGHVVVDVTETGGLPWKYCKRCDTSTPPRTNHCEFCTHCVVRRDHHCFMVGNCIGHWNQRFFVMLSAHGLGSGYLGACMAIVYLIYHHTEGTTLWNFFLPVTGIQWLLGNVSGLWLMMTFDAYMWCVFGPVCTMYFCSQILLMCEGKTMSEIKKKKNLKVTSSLTDNFRLVFGDYWMLNFLFPVHMIFKQESDGTRFEGVKMEPEPNREDQDLLGKRCLD